MTKFQQAVLGVSRIIPPGSVMSYGQVAAYIGAPRAARQVGWALRSLEGTPDFPWWRIISNTGSITIKGNEFNSRDIQKKHLEAEGVLISHELKIDIERYRYFATAKQLQSFELEQSYIETVLREFYPESSAVTTNARSETNNKRSS